MQTAVKTKKPRKQAVSGRFWAGRTYRERIKDDHKIEEKLRELHGIEISDRIPENYLALSVRRGNVDYDVIKARYPREVVEKMLELGSSIVVSRPDSAGIGYATELRLTKKKSEGIPVRIANDADAAVSILHSLTDPIVGLLLPSSP